MIHAQTQILISVLIWVYANICTLNADSQTHSQIDTRKQSLQYSTCPDESTEVFTFLV